MKTTQEHLNLNKVIKGRESWRLRSNKNQAEKRQLQDKNRYLKQKIETSSEKIIKLQCALNEKEKQLKEMTIQTKKNQNIEMQLEESKKKLEKLENRISAVEKTETVLQINQINISINIQVISVFLFYMGMISFRSVPRILEVFFSYLKYPLKICHFTSVINWCLKLGLYKLKYLKPPIKD